MATKTNPMQVQKYLSGVDYPVQKQDLIEHARSQGADDALISTLERMQDREFQTPADVSKAISQEQ